jgi:hypothetical protein
MKYECKIQLRKQAKENVCKHPRTFRKTEWNWEIAQGSAGY